jgi:hypothetical protein
MASQTNMDASRIYIEASANIYCVVFNQDKDDVAYVTPLSCAIMYGSDICYIGSPSECNQWFDLNKIDKSL